MMEPSLISEQSPIPLHVEQTDVPELLRASLHPLVEQASRSRIDLRVATLGEVPPLWVDREKLAWSVTALVGNALRYVAHGDVRGEAGGSVVVHVTRAETGEDMVAISVQDDGPGIPDDKLPFLFERREGAAYAEGLALSLVRQIVAAHGGRIDVESRRDADEHGTSITMLLPIHH
jgi:signal transduction histidine kinase